MRENRWYAGAVIGVFTISRIIYLGAGLRYFAGTLPGSWQILDAQLLRERLLESIWYLHSQPPLFNFFIGIVLKFFPGNELAAFRAAYLALGFVLSLSLFFLMARLGVPPALSVALTAIFILSPGTILFENYLFYTYFVVTFLCLSALCLHRYLQAGRWPDAAAYFCLLAALVLIRHVFHLVWFLPAASLPFLGRRNQWKKLLMLSAVPGFLTIGLYVKNLCLFGYPAASSSFGMSLFTFATMRMPKAILKETVSCSHGRVSELSLLSPVPDMKPLRDYPPQWTHCSPTGIPALDREFKYDGENSNFNHIAYLHLGRQYTADAFRIILAHPKYYLRSLLFSARTYFRPAGDFFWEGEGWPLPALTRIYDFLVYGRWARPGPTIMVKNEYGPDQPVERRVAWTLLVGFPLLVVYGALLTSRACQQFSRQNPFALTMLFMMGCIIYVSGVTTLLAMGENMRYRFVIDPFYLAIFGLLVRDLLRVLARAGSERRRRGEHD